MEIKLDLTKHCIETESKLVYNRLVSRYFKSKEDKLSLETAIEAMKSLLERVDFTELRHQHPELAGSDEDVLLVISSPQAIQIKLLDCIIPLNFEI